jgi:hypothetical protein
MLDTLRQTGRTERMIQEALRLHGEGKPVVIVVGSPQDFRRVTMAVRETVPVIQVSPSDQGWNWDELRQVGRPIETEYLIDHYTIERKFGRVLEAYHRFNR